MFTPLEVETITTPPPTIKGGGPPPGWNWVPLIEQVKEGKIVSIKVPHKRNPVGFKNLIYQKFRGAGIPIHARFHEHKTKIAVWARTTA